ncbi:hypothetical protein [Streptomyces sp. NPDC056987]|uniref:hypothetical protein n=1 Tax=Streptomyces sp. NPDC056987 TaxID=3345988 RepID=UPI00363749CB
MAQELNDLGLVSVDLLIHAFQPLVQAGNVLAEIPGLLIEVGDLEADRGQVALDDAELAVVLLRGVFGAAGQRGNLALSDGVFRPIVSEPADPAVATPTSPSSGRPGADPPYVPHERAQSAEEDHSSTSDPEGRCPKAILTNGKNEEHRAGKDAEGGDQSADAVSHTDIVNDNLGQRK